MKKKTGTLARPWKLKVRTYSPFLVSLCRTRNTPCPMWPCCRTSWAASSRDSVPWNHGYSRNICSTCVSSLPESTKQKHKWLMWNSQVYMGFLLALTRRVNPSAQSLECWVFKPEDPGSISCKAVFVSVSFTVTQSLQNKDFFVDTIIMALLVSMYYYAVMKTNI